MSPWQMAHVKDGPRNLPLMFGQNQVRNSWDIPDMEKCRQDKCWVLQQLSKGRLSKETIVQGTFVQGTAVQGDFCPRKTFVQEVKYLYFCPRNFCYRNEEKNLKIAGNKKYNRNFLQIFLKCGVRPTYGFLYPSPRLIWCKTIFNKAGWAAELSGPEKRGTGSPIETKDMVQQPNHRNKKIMWTRSAIL